MAQLANVKPIPVPLDFPHSGALTEDAKQAMLRRFYAAPFEITSDGILDPTVQARYFITKNGVCTLTLAAPTSGDDDNTELHIRSFAAFAHTVTATGLFLTGSAAVNKA